MRQILLIIVFLSGVNPILAQQNSDKIELLVSNRVVTRSTDIKSILELYENYYKSNPDSIHDNLYWNKQEKKL
jgi:antitoxin component of MazEF toxin-antitoxin module